MERWWDGKNLIWSTGSGRAPWGDTRPRAGVSRGQGLNEVGVWLWSGASSRPMWLEQQPDHGDRRQVGVLADWLPQADA